MKRVEDGFEAALWSSRLVVLVAVVASLAASLAIFYVATTDTVITISHLAQYANPNLEAAVRAEMRRETVGHVVAIIDGFLLATVLLIFALGLYELFISKIDVAKDSEAFENVLLIRSLDDLKNRLAKVILMILIVSFFERVLGVEMREPIDLLYMAGGIALIGAALWLSHAADHKNH
jgi:uncharacterized membrane protein YqhA